MLGEVGIHYIEQPLRVVNNNYRNIICIVAPFKDDSFVTKVYNSLKEAVKGEKTTATEAKGYQYLELLYKHFPDIPEIVLCNTTTNTGTSQAPVYNYKIINDRLASIFEELDEVGISFIIIPEELTIPQYMMYKSFYDEQREKMNAFGLIHQVKPTLTSTKDSKGETITGTPLLEILFNEIFHTGGSWKTITTPVKLVGTDVFTLEESVIYHAGLTANHPENESETHYIMNDVEGQITPCTYDRETFDLINNNGAIAVNYRDKIHGVVQIYNSGTQTWNQNLEDTLDLKHERVHALLINEFKIGLLGLLGKDNNTVTYDNFESLARSIRDKYISNSYINGLKWNITKSGTAKITVLFQEKQNNIITNIDVVGQILIGAD